MPESNDPPIHGQYATAAPLLDSAPAADQLMHRLGILEQEIQQLKKTLQHERKLLRKAILIQMDMDVDEELD